MSNNTKLISFHLIERQNGENIITWTYPTISAESEKFLLLKCFTYIPETGFFCMRKNNTYYQIQQNMAPFAKPFAIVIQTTDFDPEKYKILCDIFYKTYTKCQNPVELVKLYLNLFTSGACKFQRDEILNELNLKQHQSEIHLKDLIASFQLEIILLYNAILLKRRVILFDNNLESLQKELFSVSHLVPCRNPADYLIPLINNPKELKGLSFYVAATTNCDLLKEHKIYDIFVDLETRQISLSPQAEEIMVMSKTHKEIASFLVKVSESELSETEVKEQIEKKTNDILNLLKNISTQNDLKLITMNNLKSKNFHAALENFLFNLALAENLMML